MLEAAYHGHTNTCIDLSPYKHDGPGGSGPPDWVHTAAIPDVYRGPMPFDDSNATRLLETFDQILAEDFGG